MFTPYERRQLRQIEQWFEQDDPQLARTLRSGPTKKPSNAPRTIAICAAVSLGLLGIMTGVFMLILSATIAGLVAALMIAGQRKTPL